MPKKSIDQKGSRFFGAYAKPTYTMVPDELFDEQLADLSGAELKVLLYIMRRTFGFKKDSDLISLSQISNGITTHDGRVLDRGTGLSKSNVVVALKSLSAMGLVISERRQSAEKGYEPTVYRLNVLQADPLVLKQNKGSPKTGQALVLKQDIQETVLQETVQQQDDDDIRGALEAFGISPGQAQRVAETYPADLILEKLDQVSYLVERRSSLVSRNPQGFLIKAIEDNYLPHKPRGYQSRAEREAQAQQRQAQETELEQARLDREQAIAAYKQQQRPRRIPGSKLTTSTTWEQALTTLQGLMTAANFNTWLKHTVLVEYRDGRALIAAPSNYVAEWLRVRMNPLVQRALFETLGQTVQTAYMVMPELAGTDGD